MGIVALSINPELYTDSQQKPDIDRKFVDDLFWLTFYHQHLGQEYSGLATLASYSEKPFLLRTHRGLFRDKFESDLSGFEAPLGVGHISGGFREPYQILSSSFGNFIICFAGNLSNKEEIISKLVNKGQGLDRTDDVALIARLIGEAGYDSSKKMSDNILSALSHMTYQIEGAYALAILIRNKIYVARGPDAHECLTIGKKKGAVSVVSESNSFFNQGFEIVRELTPGEVIYLKSDEFWEVGKISILKGKSIIAQPCSFKWVYTSDPAAILNDLSAAEARSRLGAKHARRDMAKGFIPHFILPVPVSGRFHALGYKREFDRALNRGEINQVPYYNEDLEKYSYSGRSYTPATQIQRDLEARKKIIPIRKYINLELIEASHKNVKLLLDDRLIEARVHDGRCVIEIDVVLLDDSIVRGTQTANNLIPKLKKVFSNSISEIIEKLSQRIKVTVKLNIHLRVGDPKLVSVCDWGKSNKEQNNLAAVDPETGRIRSSEEIAERSGVATCYFSEVKDISDALGIPLTNLCVDCNLIKKDKR